MSLGAGGTADQHGIPVAFTAMARKLEGPAPRVGHQAWMSSSLDGAEASCVRTCSLPRSPVSQDALRVIEEQPLIEAPVEQEVELDAAPLRCLINADD